MRGGAPKLERGFSGDRFDIRGAADAVSSENFLAHGCLIRVTETCGGSMLTTVTPRGREISTSRSKLRAELNPVRLTTACIWLGWRLFMISGGPITVAFTVWGTSCALCTSVSAETGSR